MNTKSTDSREDTPCGGIVNYTTSEQDLVIYAGFKSCLAGDACQGCSWNNICPDGKEAKNKQRIALVKEAKDLFLTTDAQDSIEDLQRIIITQRLANEKRLQDQNDSEAKLISGIYNLACFETLRIGMGWDFTRVPGGWLSTTVTNGLASETFVPFSQEFNPAFNTK